MFRKKMFVVLTVGTLLTAAWAIHTEVAQAQSFRKTPVGKGPVGKTPVKVSKRLPNPGIHPGHGHMPGEHDRHHPGWHPHPGHGDMPGEHRWHNPVFIPRPGHSHWHHPGFPPRWSERALDLPAPHRLPPATGSWKLR